MKEFKTVKVCTDEIMNQMSVEGWRIEHLQFDGDVLRGVFSRAKKDAPVIIAEGVAVNTVETKEVPTVLVGIAPDVYQMRPMLPLVYPQNLIEVKPLRKTVEERKAELDAQIVDGMRAYWDEVGIRLTPSRPLLGVSNG